MTTAVGIGGENAWYAPTLLSPAGDYGSFGGDLKDNGNYAGVNGTEQAPTGGGGTSVAWFSNGSDSRGVDLGNAFSNNHYSNTTGKTSLSFWMLPEATNSVVTVGSGLYGTPAIEVRLNCGRDSNGDMYASFESGGSVLLNANLGSGTTNMIHVAMVWDDNVRAAIYKNGVLVAEDTTVGTWKSGYLGGALMKSATSAGLNTGGGGYIDDFRIYRSILSEAQITHLATERKVLGAVGLGGEKLWLSPSVGHSNYIAMDMSGTSNNGTYRNGVSIIADTSSGGTLAFDFDGTDDRIDLPSTILGGSQVFSMACWVYVDSHDQNDGQGYMGQVELGYPAGSNDVAALYSGGWNTSPDFAGTSWRSITFAGGSYGYTSVPNSLSPPTGSWHHIACVADGSVNTLYVDGVAQLYPSSYTGSFPTPSSSFQIGRYGSSNNGCLDGRMDDCRAYHRALTQSEITHLASQRGVEGPAPVGLGDEKLWLCPTLNESANDLSGNGNNGTLSGMSFNSDADGKSFYQGSSNSDKVTGSFSTPFDAKSISFWTSSSSTTSSSVHLSDSSTGTTKLGDSRYSKRYRVNVDGSAGNYASTFINQSVWHHVVCTYDPDSQVSAVYINGVLDGQTTGVTGSTTTDSYEVGAVQQWSRFDDIRAYDRVLTQAEITHLAEARGIEGPPPVGLGDEQLWLCPSLNDSANDISGSGNDGTYNGGMGTVADTSNGGSLAYDFDGTDDYIDCGSAISNTTFSMSGWFNTDTGYGSMAGSYRWQLSQRSFYIRLDSSTPEFMLGSTGGSSGNIKITSSSSVSTGTWYHIAATWDSTTGDMKLFLDGSLVASGTQSGMAALVEPLCIGSYSTVESFFNGKQDDIRFYQRVLTQSEITHLASQRGVEGPPPVGLGDEQLWLCPSLNDSANDISGSGNDGTYQGGMGTVADTGAGGSLAYDFDGVSDYISIPNLDGTFTAAGSYSISLWAYDSVGLPYWNAYPTSSGSSRTQFLYVQNTNTRCLYGQNSSYGIANSFHDTNQWTCITHTFDVGTGIASVYKNGILFHSQTLTANSSGTTLAEIGKVDWWNGGSVEYSQSLVDDVRAYNRTLTQSEITHLASSRGVEGPPPVGLGDEQLWWCPTHSQSLLADSSPQGHSVVKVATAPALVADTDEGGQYAGQFAANGSVRVQDQFQFMTTGDVSVSGWIKAATADQVTICGQQTGGLASNKSGVAVDQYLGESRAKFFDGINNDKLLLLGGNTPPNNTWYHVTATKDGTACKLFVNGVLLASGTQLGIPSSPDYKDLLIGGAWNGNNALSATTGYMDDIRVFDRALTQAEITHLAEARGIEGPPPVGLGDEKLWLCPSINDSANDISGSGNDGTYNGGMATVLSDGKLAYDFDGTDDYIDIQGLTGQYAIGGSYSTSIWVYQDTVKHQSYFYRYQSAHQVYFGGSTAQTTEWLNAAATDTRTGAGFNSTVTVMSWSLATVNNLNANGTNQSGAWYNLVTTYDSTTKTQTLYKNGVNVGSIVYGANSIEVLSTDYAEVGRHIGTSNYFAGKMDDVRSFTRVLTQSEITHLAEARGIEGPPPVGLGDEQLWLCPSLNDSANDISGNGNNGTYNSGISTVADTDATYGGSRAYFSNAQSQSVSVANFGESLAETTTISLWTKSTNPYVCVPIVNGAFGYSANTWQYAMFNSTTTRIFYNRSTSTNFPTATPNNQWQHICIVRETGSSTQEVYVDGTLVATAASSTATYGINTLWSGFGNSIGTGEELFVDDIRTYGRVLSQAEITHLATSRGIEGGPSTPDVFFNPFKSTTFQNQTFNNGGIGE